MANVIPHRDIGSAPAVDVPRAVDGHGSDKGRQPSLKRPAPPPLHRVVHGVGQVRAQERDAAYNRLRPNHRWDDIKVQIERDRRVSDWLYSAVIWTGVIFMGVVLLWMACDAYFDRVLGL